VKRAQMDSHSQVDEIRWKVERILSIHPQLAVDRLYERLLVAKDLNAECEKILTENEVSNYLIVY
jgi:hypothetical protein